jgi:hypothetical protein
MSLLGDVGGLISGFISDKKTNKLSKQQLKSDQALTAQQVQMAQFIEGLAKQIVSHGSNVSDSYGNEAYYDPASGTYKTTLSGTQKTLQDASDQEELKRQVLDNAMRRGGLNDFERSRQRSVGEANTALSGINAFRRGVGRVDPNQVASQLRADRTGAVNAGYDDAERAAQTLQLRTGSSSLTDAIANLGRDRARSLATTMGNPELEGDQYARQANSDTQKQLFDVYSMFNNEGKSFYDNPFNPSTAADKADARLADTMKFDLSKYDLAMGGEGSAAAAIGNAQTRGQAAFQNYMGNRVVNPTGKLITGADAAIESAIKAAMSGGGGGGFNIGKFLGG